MNKRTLAILQAVLLAAGDVLANGRHLPEDAFLELCQEYAAITVPKMTKEEIKAVMGKPLWELIL